VYLYIFRVDSGNIPELGTGHLYRCIKIYKYLVSKGINKKDILFIVKISGKYDLSKKILNRFKINFKVINEKIKDFSKKEELFLIKFTSKVIIFDRLSKINKSFLKNIRKNFKKIIGIDIKKDKDAYLNYFINPLNNNLIQNKKINNYKNNILPSFGEIKKINKSNKAIKKIFIFFGVYDFKKINKKISKVFLNSSKFVAPSSKKNFFKLMNSSDLVICSGGLTVFDAIFLNKIIITIPQYNHQLKNLKTLQKAKVIFLCELNKNFEKNIKKIMQFATSLSYKERLLIYNKQKKIISNRSQLRILKKISDV